MTKPRVLIRPAVIMALLAGACSDSGTGENVPVPEAVVPNAGYATVTTAVEISGAKFLAKATQQSSGGNVVDTTHRAWLGDVELGDVTWVDATKLTATVPAGLAVGAQKLTVENALGERGTLDNAFTVLAAPAFSATVSVDRTTVNVGQPFTLTLALANDGGAEVNAIMLGAPVLTPADTAGTSPCGPAPAAPATLALGGRQSFSWTCQGAAPGPLAATFGPTTGKDALLGSALTATPPASVQVTVQRPAALAAALSIPQSVAVNADFTVTMTVTNAVDAADARAVTPGTLSVVPVLGAGAGTLKAGPTPASALVHGGQSVDFVWTYTAPAAPDSLSLAVGASGTDGNSGSTVTAATNGLMTVQ